MKKGSIALREKGGGTAAAHLLDSKVIDEVVVVLIETAVQGNAVTVEE